MSEELLREAEVVTEFLYGTRSRTAARNLLSSRFERREENAEQRRNNPNPYDVYFISSKQQTQPVKTNNLVQQQQQNRRPRTLQRGVTTPVTNPSTNHDFAISPESKMRCNSSTCDFWPHCSQRDTLYSPNQGPVFMKVSQSYPAHQRMNETGNQANRGSTCSSPASLEKMDDRETRDRENSKKNRQRDVNGGPKYQERLPKGVLKHSRWSHEKFNGHMTNVDKREYRKSDFGNSFEAPVKPERKVSPNQVKSLSKSPSGVAISPSTTSSSSSSDIWVTTSDRTATKSPRNAKSSGASTPMEDAMAGSLKTLIEPPRDGMLSRPGSAPAKRENSLPGDVILDPQQRSLSLPKSFLAHNSTER